MHESKGIKVKGFTHNLVSVSMDEANISNALVMFPKFLVLSTSKSYNLFSMLTASASLFAILASRAVSNAMTSVHHDRFSFS